VKRTAYSCKSAALPYFTVFPSPGGTTAIAAHEWFIFQIPRLLHRCNKRKLDWKSHCRLMLCGSWWWWWWWFHDRLSVADYVNGTGHSSIIDHFSYTAHSPPCYRLSVRLVSLFESLTRTCFDDDSLRLGLLDLITSQIHRSVYYLHRRRTCPLKFGKNIFREIIM